MGHLKLIPCPQMVAADGGTLFLGRLMSEGWDKSSGQWDTLRYSTVDIPMLTR